MLRSMQLRLPFHCSRKCRWQRLLALCEQSDRCPLGWHWGRAWITTGEAEEENSPRAIANLGVV